MMALQENYQKANTLHEIMNIIRETQKKKDKNSISLKEIGALILQDIHWGRFIENPADLKLIVTSFTGDFHKKFAEKFLNDEKLFFRITHGAVAMVMLAELFPDYATPLADKILSQTDKKQIATSEEDEILLLNRFPELNALKIFKSLLANEKSLNEFDTALTKIKPDKQKKILDYCLRLIAAGNISAISIQQVREMLVAKLQHIGECSQRLDKTSPISCRRITHTAETDKGIDEHFDYKK